MPTATDEAKSDPGKRGTDGMDVEEGVEEEEPREVEIVRPYPGS